VGAALSAGRAAAEARAREKCCKSGVGKALKETLAD